MPLLTFRKKLTLLALFLTFGVILLGAYTRLMDAGLGCPDWPGCYGFWRVPLSEIELSQARISFPSFPVDAIKAHTEMIHRYFASTLGLFILMIAGLTLFSKGAKISQAQKILAVSLVGVVIFQGLLGMWTVTLKLLPIVVMSHLLGGLLLLSLLFSLWMMQKSPSRQSIEASPFTRKLAIAALVMVGIQIALGGWTSTNYAALSCPDFPLCQNQLWPKMSWQAFDLVGAAGLENPLSYMTLEARTAIHMSHRIGALITTLLLSTLIVCLWRDSKRSIHVIALMGALLIIQLALGITNVLAHLPLSVAVAHNGIATLLLLSLIGLQFYLKPQRGTLA